MVNDNRTTNNSWFVFFAQRARRSIRGTGSGAGMTWTPANASGKIASSARLSNTIVLWGPPGSGKSTYLAALDAALAANSWRLAANDLAGMHAIVGLKNDLIGKRRFPPSTRGLNIIELVISGTLSGAVRSRFGGRAKQIDARIILKILDPAGEIYRSDQLGSHLEGELADSLAGADAIVLFFDPVREYDHGDNYEYFHAMITHLMERNSEMTGREFAGSPLRHRVAVCISKLDTPKIFASARACGYLDVGPDAGDLPAVREERAEEFFEMLCRTVNGGRALYLHDELKRSFEKTELRYFGVSSTGFYRDRSMNFSADDACNSALTASGDRVRGNIYPVNVLEPMIWCSAPDRHAAAPRRRHRRPDPAPAEKSAAGQGIALPAAAAASTALPASTVRSLPKAGGEGPPDTRS